MKLKYGEWEHDLSRDDFRDWPNEWRMMTRDFIATPDFPEPPWECVCALNFGQCSWRSAVSINGYAFISGQRFSIGDEIHA